MLLIPLLRHYLTAGNEHDLHSPYLFEFYNQVVKSRDLPSNAVRIELLRKTLKADHRTIEIEDFGAGSRWHNSNFRKISSIAKTSEKAQKWQVILFQVIERYFGDATILELGTSLGLTTAYLASANSSNRVHTFEGCPKIAGIAEQTFHQLQLANISQIVGNIDDTLPNFLSTNPKIDFVFFDANHRYEPTMRYFESCLQYATAESVFVFDDIYWSDEMYKAWEQIKNHHAVRQTLDFCQMGFVFFRKTQPKQHFRLKA